MARPTATGPVLTRRQLNRATLDRQLLLRREQMPVVDAVEHLLGLQAQVPLVPYTTLWTRLAGFTPDQLADPLRDRLLVRASLMRSTVHLVTAADALGLRPHMHVVMARTFDSTSWAKRLREQDADLEMVLAAGRELLDERPRSRAELTPVLAGRFPDLDAESMSMAVTFLLPTVQATPRGLWAERGMPRWTTMSGWLGGREPQPMELRRMVLRYLRAFGPASVKDIQAWCSLTRLREVTDGLGEQLRRYRTEEGGELLDLAEATLPDPDTPAPVRLLAEYDNATLGYSDRRRIIADGDHEWLSGGPGGAVGSVLVDGSVRATWALRRSGPDARLELHPVRTAVPGPVAARSRTRPDGCSRSRRQTPITRCGGAAEPSARHRIPHRRPHPPHGDLVDEPQPVRVLGGLDTVADQQHRHAHAGHLLREPVHAGRARRRLRRHLADVDGPHPLPVGADHRGVQPRGRAVRCRPPAPTRDPGGRSSAPRSCGP